MRLNILDVTSQLHSLGGNQRNSPWLRRLRPSQLAQACVNPSQKRFAWRVVLLVVRRGPTKPLGQARTPVLHFPQRALETGSSFFAFRTADRGSYMQNGSSAR